MASTPSPGWKSMRRGRTRRLTPTLCLAVVAISFVVVTQIFCEITKVLYTHHLGDKGDNNNLLAWGLFGNNYAGQFKSLSKQLFNAAFDHTDKDDSGYLEQKEVEEMVIQMMLEEGIETMKTETAGLPRDQSTLCWERMQRDLIEKIESAEIRAHRAKEILNFLDQDGDGRLSRTEVLGAFSPEFLEECKVSELGEMEFCERMDRYINVLKAIGLLDWSKVEEIKKVPFEDAETARKTTLAMIKLLRQAAANRS